MDVPSCSSKQLIRAALRLGFIIRQGGKGSHTKLQYANGRVLIVPETKDIGRGLRTRLVKDMADTTGRSVEDVIRLLSISGLAVLLDIFKRLFG